MYPMAYAYRIGRGTASATDVHQLRMMHATSSMIGCSDNGVGILRVMDRELYVRNIPPGMTSIDQIALGPSLPPLQFTRRELVEAVLEIDPTVVTSRSDRLNVVQPGLRIAIGIPHEDPLSTVLIRVTAESDRWTADQFIGRLLDKLNARAFDTASETLIFTPPR
jgi:hypothetical protein